MWSKQDTRFLESPFKFRLLWGRAAAWVSKLAEDRYGSHPGAILQVELEPTGETRVFCKIQSSCGSLKTINGGFKVSTAERKIVLGSFWC